jgi:hypothetical protein
VATGADAKSHLDGPLNIPADFGFCTGLTGRYGELDWPNFRNPDWHMARSDHDRNGADNEVDHFQQKLTGALALWAFLELGGLMRRSSSTPPLVALDRYKFVCVPCGTQIFTFGDFALCDIIILESMRGVRMPLLLEKLSRTGYKQLL